MTTTESELERTVREEQEAHDALETEPRRQNVETEEPDEVESPTPEGEEPEEGDEKALFDAADYDREDLQIPKVDGVSIDKIRVDFAGSILLDRSDPADVALINKLKLAKDVELRVAGSVSGVGAGFTTNREGDFDAVVLSKKVKVSTVWVLDATAL